MQKTGYVALFVFLIVLVAACGSQKTGLFARRTPHEQYQHALENAGLARSALYQAWVTAAKNGLSKPSSVTIPYRETGFFPAEQPRAAGYAFNAQRGEKIQFSVEQSPQHGKLFSELWKIEDTTRKLLYAADSSTAQWQYEVGESAQYMIRIQPELLKPIGYTVTIETGPSLAFPVQTSANPRIASFWGDQRDAGARKHEGIDIFAPKRTPAIAAADGVAHRVGENNLGGKVVFFRPDKQNYSLYYAHLDSQLVTEGQRLKAGDTIGLVGNTGNAKNTPPHLHFGIYARGGAIDPYPFVNRNRRQAEKVTGDTSVLNLVMRTKASTSFLFSLEPGAASRTLVKNSAVTALAGAAAHFKVELPDGSIGFVRTTQLTAAPVQTRKSASLDTLWNSGQLDQIMVRTIETGTPYEVLAVWQDYEYIKMSDQSTGWRKASR